MDPRNGNILALAEKTDRAYKKNGFDLAWPPEGEANRSSGSTIKPFTLAAALMRGHSLDEVVDAPNCLHYPQYNPCNAEGTGGVYTLRSALEQSINTVFIPLAKSVGLSRVFSLAQRAGMMLGPLRRDCGTKERPALCLSQAIGVPTSPMGEADAFGTLVDHGVHHEPNSLLQVQSALDGTLYQAPRRVPGDRVMPRRVADAVTGVMQGVVDHGTGTEAKQPFPVYGKTGTTDDFTDAWFTGCTRTVCISVWMGYAKSFIKVGHQYVPHSMKDVESAHEVFGGTLPAQIFAKTFSNYRALLHPAPSPTATPSPAFTPHFSPSSRPPSATPRPRASRTSRVSPSTSTSPRPTPSRSLLPTPP
jgi:membrane peptidoglycan carboxypeptidase